MTKLTSEQIHELRELVAKHNLERIASLLEEKAQSAIQIVTAKPDDYSVLGRSRIGGVPDLPPEFEWPKIDERYLVFVAQINLSELPKYDDSPLPSKGILYFFYGRDEPEMVDYHSVLYYGGNSDILRKPQQPDVRHFIDKENYTFFEPYLLEMKRVISTPSYHSANWGTVDGYFPEDEHKESGLSDRYFALQAEALNKFEVHWTQQSQMLGYPDWYSALEIAHQAQATREGKDPFFDDYELNADEVKKWVLLLQLASHDDLGMMWSDMGRLQFIIHGNDLEKSDFTKTYASVKSS